MDYNIQVKQRNISNNVQNFFKNCPSKITNVQTYYPIMDDHSYFQNNFNKNKNSIFNNQNTINNIEYINNDTENDTENDNIEDKKNKTIEDMIFKKTYTSNIYDRFSNKTDDKDVFFKISSILCPLTYIKNEYSENSNVNMPHIRKYVSKRHNKILDKNNTTYIDSFCSYMFSKLVENDICTGFPLYYGNYIGIAGTYMCNMTEEYENYKDDKWFKNSLNKKFKLHMIDVMKKKKINLEKNIDDFFKTTMDNEINLHDLNKQLELFKIDASNKNSIELYDVSDEDEKFNDSDSDVYSDNSDNVNLINILTDSNYKFTLENTNENYNNNSIGNMSDNNEKTGTDSNAGSNADSDAVSDAGSNADNYPDSGEVSDSISEPEDSDNESNDSNDGNDSNDNEKIERFNKLIEIESGNFNDIDLDNLSNISEASIESTSMSFEKEIDVYCELHNMPVNIIISENLDGTLEDLIQIDKKILNKCKKQYTFENYDNDNSGDFYNSVEFMEIENRWLAYLWQIIFALAIAQKYYKFTHNDLHTSNVMYKKTTIQYLYYNVNGKYYKIATHGYILKIIDFGRGVLKINKNIYFSDVFSKDAEAGEQYTYPFEKNTSTKETYPNMSFDLSRLSTSMIDDLFSEYPTEKNDGKVLSRDNQKETTSELFNLLYTWITDKYGRLVTVYNDFNLYKVIARRVDSAIPHKQLTKNIFNRFLISNVEIKTLNKNNIKIYKL
jgi:hypothetical protein